jgi:hypothetical protein
LATAFSPSIVEKTAVLREYTSFIQCLIDTSLVVMLNQSLKGEAATITESTTMNMVLSHLLSQELLPIGCVMAALSTSASESEQLNLHPLIQRG